MPPTLLRALCALAAASPLPALASAPTAPTAPGQAACTVRALHAFAPDGVDGTQPGDGLFLGRDGHLFGVTTGGGSRGYGTVFELSPDGTETILHDFAAGTGDGADPTTPPIADPAGGLVGTTYLGGAHGQGTVYRLDASGALSLLHSFSGDDGANPDAPLLSARDGALYGTTLQGGSHGRGVLYRITLSGGFELLHAFGAAGDLAHPTGPLVQARDGTIYGAGIDGGGTGSGGLFAYSPRSAEPRVLLSLRAETDCSLPMGGVMQLRDGRLVGTGYAGGPMNAGCVFAAQPDGSLRVLHHFTGGEDGAQPASLPLEDAQGRLLFTSSLGSTHGDGALLALGGGDGNVSVMHAFGPGDVSVPSGNLVQGADGHVYGTAPFGGAHGRGGVFEGC